ncbi:MAG: S41 family peptidase [Candidatus Omnitrophica bacterium]|nr:S41 family peptidase [Candidatus Omnitrophota bacterium]MBU4479607.1 S41 family peptidase [Candidatus Omnitrophota bacterium]MCG2703408.1 S41 family peptidase [Candidatus Omnitrophota bacterium]
MFKRKIYFLAVACIVIVFILNGPANSRPQSAKDDLYNQIEIFSDAISSIQNDYVDSVAPKDIIYGALKGMLSALDPYSQFMDSDTFKELQVETEGHFGGLGIEITLKDKLLTIISPLDGTPAQKAGLKPQDRILKINEKITRDITLTEAVKLMRGEPGTKVTLTIMRENEDGLKDYIVTRDIINIKSVKKAAILTDNIGYIKLTDFSETTKSNLDEALKKLGKEGMDSLILDLRNNPGGLLVSSVETASEFLSTGALVVSTRGREKSQNTEYRATGKSNFREIPLIILVNEGSASASEIVAGAIQDHKRGIILGTKSFGKGSVQTVIPLRDGSALRLTTARYYTPSGRTINEKGIIPDVEVKFEPPKETQEAKKEEDNVFDKIKEEKKPEEPANTDNNNNEENTVPGDNAPAPEKKEELYNSDNQLRAAVNLMRGLKIYREYQLQAQK